LRPADADHGGGRQPTPAIASAANGIAEFTIASIGYTQSAGGLETLQKLFGRLPPGSPPGASPRYA
jgi:hypothetical protein